MVDSRLSGASSLPQQSPSYVHPAEEWDPESGVPPPARKPGEASWAYFARCGWLARNEAERLGYFDAPAARADQARADRRAREALLGVSPKHPRLARQRRPPLAIRRRRVHRERRPGAVRVARRRSTSSASRDGPDDLDPSPAPAVAARIVAAAAIHHTFAELRDLVAPRFSPAEGLQVFSLLPSEAEEEAWAQ
jgi:hypothetical protein